MQDTFPWNEMNQEQSNALFNRFAAVLKDAFGFARQLGIKTCVGTETPLIIPKPVRERLEAAGKSPTDPATVQSVYEGMFRRIMAAYPIDYYWLWTPEGWTWENVKQEQHRRDAGRFRRRPESCGGCRCAVSAGHVWLGAGTTASPRAVRRNLAEVLAGELHQPQRGTRSGRARICGRRGSTAVGDPVVGR